MNKENKKVNDRELKLIFVLGGIVLFLNLPVWISECPEGK